MLSHHLLTIIAHGLLAHAAGPPQYPPHHAPHEIETVNRDVVVIGGGAAGTHAAIRLQQEGKSVAVVERNGRLGGHVNTYVDPATGETFDFGVIIYIDIPLVRSYFDYLGVHYANFSNPPSEYADILRGNTVSTAQAASITGNTTEAFATWIEHLERYPWLTNQSGYHLPDPFPEELLMPFGDYLVKYGMGGLATLLDYTNLAGNILALPTFYMMKWQDLPGSTSQLINQADGDNQAIYNAALSRLGNGTNVFLNSHVEHIQRNDSTVEVIFATPKGQTKVHASQLVMAIPPKVETLHFLDLSMDERSTLGHFNNSYVYNTVVLNTGAPHDFVIQNFDPQAPLGVPAMPATAVLFPSANIPNAHEVEYGSPHYLPEDYVKEQMLASVAKIQEIYNFTSPNGTQVELVDFHNHSPYLFTVSNEAIKGGFYNDLNELQGKQRTWWTSSAFETEASTSIWNFTEYEILPGLLRSLDG